MKIHAIRFFLSSTPRSHGMPMHPRSAVDTTHRMNLSGILVTTETRHVDVLAQALALLPGLEVCRTDVAAGRIVVVQEAADVGAEVEGFARIRALPQVLAADLVCHCFDDDTAPNAGDASPP